LRVADAVGTLAAVFVLPEDVNITSGSPKSHRNYLDIYLSQYSHAYLRDLIEYQKVLKQRNALLRNIKSGREGVSQLDVWDEGLIKWGARVMNYRATFINDISGRVSKIVQALSRSRDSISISYIPRIPLDRGLDVLREGRARDIRIGSSLLGPHRDHLGITINDHPLRPFGSLGQKKSVMMAMKLAALEVLSECRREQAILIMDEAFSDLDSSRCESLLGLLSGYGQVFLASAAMSGLENEKLAIFDISDGSVRRREN